MRLINVMTMQMERYDYGIPVYTILSHTWNVTEEIDLATFQRGVGVRERFSGWKKVQRCCEQTRNDGYRYTWIDTCCIDNTNLVELSEAINSMYRWYKNAAVCYAYLVDVDHSLRLRGGTDCIDRIAKRDDWHLRNSRWFTRGWTLQELLAPSYVVFYGKDWVPLGTRESLLDVIHQVTQIQPEYLSSPDAIRQATVATIFSWAARRQTQRPEDHVYSLLGLLNIHMPLIYGEGHHAFQRLQLELLQKRDDDTLFLFHEHKFAESGW